MSDPSLSIVVATRDRVLVLPEDGPRMEPVRGLDDRSPTCLASHPQGDGSAWCGTTDSGVYRSDDGGRSWLFAGLEGAHVTALTVDPTQEGVVWMGTEPSAIWMGRWEPGEGGAVEWQAREGLLDLPSSDEWSFPPRPETHHVRWIACHPSEPGCGWRWRPARSSPRRTAEPPGGIG